MSVPYPHAIWIPGGQWLARCPAHPTFKYHDDQLLSVQAVVDRHARELHADDPDTWSAS